MNFQIAPHMELVETHRQNIRVKLDIHTTVGLASGIAVMRP